MMTEEKANLASKIIQLMDKLPFHSCALENNIPLNGVYLFFETEEPEGLLRVRRIGTHSKDKGLVRRLTDHYFADKNNSVFRKHLGAALLKRKGEAASKIQQWIKQDTPTLWNIEDQISDLLRQRFQFKCLVVAEPERRKTFEEKLISLFSRCFDHPATGLGRDAHDTRIVDSGLWNIEHVDDGWVEDNEAFLKAVSELANITHKHYSYSPHRVGVDTSKFNSINRRIAKCQSSSDVLECLTDLHDETRDPYAALCLARELARRGRIDKAIKYYRASLDPCPQEHCLPWPKYRHQAANELGELVRRADVVQVGAEPKPARVLIVVSCTYRKKWQQNQTFDDPSAAYDEAQKAYTGDALQQWEIDRQEEWLKKVDYDWIILSGKYGFIEPTHPIAYYDCTFGKFETGPISRGSLRAQALYQTRLFHTSEQKWRQIPLSSFNVIVCHRSCNQHYRDLVEFSFGPEKVVEWERFKQTHQIP